MYLKYNTQFKYFPNKRFFCVIIGQVIKFIVAHLAGHRFYSRVTCPIWPQLGTVTG